MHLSDITEKSILRASEPSMMEYFGGIAEFSPRRIRRLEHQHFEMIQAYLWHAGTGSELLAVNRLTRGEAPDSDVLAIFQRDHEGSLDALAGEHLTPDREHFAEAFTARYPGEDTGAPYEVRYQKVASEEFHGIRDLDEAGPFLSQALYDSHGDDSFYLALVEWEREWLTAWFGMELRKDQLSFL